MTGLHAVLNGVVGWFLDPLAFCTTEEAFSLAIFNAETQFGFSQHSFKNIRDCIGHLSSQEPVIRLSQFGLPQRRF